MDIINIFFIFYLFLPNILDIVFDIVLAILPAIEELLELDDFFDELLELDDLFDELLELDDFFDELLLDELVFLLLLLIS